MKKVDISLQVMIAEQYLKGTKYKDIMFMFQINRWDIQNALSHFNIKTNRIKSYPRLPGGKKVVPGRLMDRYHDGDYLPPMKVNKNNPVLEDDLDIMERMDNTDDAGKGSYEMVIDENGKVKYENI